MVISLGDLFGNTDRVHAFDLLLPLDDLLFTEYQFVTGLGGSAKKASATLRYLVSVGILVADNSGPETSYFLNPRSRRVWALNQVVHAMLDDQRRYESMEKMGIKNPGGMRKK